jgi:hypothetical protein
VDLTLQRPDLLDDEAWRAIELHRGRLATAIAVKDAPLVVGSAKELVECVARVATTVEGVVTPSNADFAEVVNRAHVALDRQAGKGITRASDIRAIAQNAKEIVLSVKDLRNDFGTGHGRAEVKSIADEMVTLVVGGALLWVRWALTRLEHLILGAPDSLIAELADSRAANPFESVLRAIALDVPGLDLVPQFRIDRNGKCVGRVDLARAVGRDLELGAGGEGGLAHGSVLFVVEPGQPRGQPLDRGLELGVEVHKRAQLVGQPLEGDFLFPATGRQLLDAAIREVHAGEAIATYAAWLSQPRGIPPPASVSHTKGELAPGSATRHTAASWSPHACVCVNAHQRGTHADASKPVSGRTTTVAVG